MKRLASSATSIKVLLNLLSEQFFRGFGYMIGWRPGSPVFGLLFCILFFAFATNVFWGESWMMQIAHATLGGPDPSAISEDSHAPTLPSIDAVNAATLFQGEDMSAGLSDQTTVPEEFSGYFFVFDNSLQGSANPSNDALSPTTERTGVLSYTVKDGDTAGAIAQKFGINTDSIKWANNLDSGLTLKTGETLKILPVSGILHKVADGETLYGIGKLYGVNISAILAVNGISRPDEISIGEDLIIPGAAPEIPGVSDVATAVHAAPSYLDNAASTAGYFHSPTIGLNWGTLHHYNAVDIANVCGTPVWAAASGYVTKADDGFARGRFQNEGYGNLVVISHSNGVETWYAHLSTILVSVGAYVNQGDQIGDIGNTGLTEGPTGCHLHFEVHGAKNPFARS